MEPLATYSDKSHAGIRNYRLYPDRIAVTHRDVIKGEAEATIRLEDMNPDFEKFAVRGAMLWAGVWILLVASLIYWTLIELTHVDPFGTFAGFFLALCFVGVFVAVVGLKKQRFVRFRNVGGTPALDVFREGPKKHEFDAFLLQLGEAIQNARKLRT